MVKSLLLQALAFWRRRQSRRIPYTELQAKHVENLKTVADRASLLDYLPKQSIVAEVGVLSGDFSQLIWDKTQPAQMHLIDLWSGETGNKHLAAVKKRFATGIREGRIILHQGSSTAVLGQFPKSSMDWIYLDTDHAYQTTAVELELSANVLKDNGLLLGHDYVTGNWDGGVRYGVVEAVNEFCVRNHWAFVYLTAETHRHLSFGIKKMEAQPMPL